MTVTTKEPLDPSWPPDRAAEGRLEELRRFLNTVNHETGLDSLADLDNAAAWLRGRGVDAEAPTESDRRRLVRFRERTRDLLASRGTAGEADAIRAWTRAGRGIRLTMGGDGLHLQPTNSGVRGVIEDFSITVALAGHDGSLAQLKVCKNDGCRWSFYDHSRSRTGAWCSMDACGSRTKMRAYRKRRQVGESWSVDGE